MSLNAYVPFVDATSSDGSSPATILQKMQSLTSREFISAPPYHPPPGGGKRRAPGRAGRPKSAVEQRATRDLVGLSFFLVMLTLTATPVAAAGTVSTVAVPVATGRYAPDLG